MRFDPTGYSWWGDFWEGVSLLCTGLLACATAAAVVSMSVCTPVIVLAGITFSAGGVTTLNGVAEVIESTTGYNFMRDGLYRGDVQFYEMQKSVFATAAEIGTVMLALTGESGTNVCFVAGTMVLAADGLRVIESIEKGDYVWAWDEESGDVALKKVVETYVSETDELIHVFVNGEEIISTPSHPFYSPVKGWIAAAHLQVDDILVLVNGEHVVVEKVQYERLETPAPVYNFQVDEYHTYYVSDTGILVHNKCPRKSDIKQIRDVAKEAGISDDYRRAFGDYVEDSKYGLPRNYTYSYSELLEIAKEFKELWGLK